MKIYRRTDRFMKNWFLMIDAKGHHNKCQSTHRDECLTAAYSPEASLADNNARERWRERERDTYTDIDPTIAPPAKDGESRLQVSTLLDESLISLFLFCCGAKLGKETVVA